MGKNSFRAVGHDERGVIALRRKCITNSRDTWEEMVAGLSGTHQVWTLDFRGHGHSGRATAYDILNYITDAEAALATIGRRTAVVGHSLGACVAGVLAQRPHPSVAGVFLEDPPWFLGEPGEWERSGFFKLFPAIASRQSALQAAHAPLSDYVDFVSNAPSPLGGVAKNHLSSRHLLSRASGLQRQDNGCWGDRADELATARFLSNIEPAAGRSGSELVASVGQWSLGHLVRSGLFSDLSLRLE